MTYSKSVTLMCDGDGEEKYDQCFEMYDIQVSTATKAREIAKKDGWVYRNGNDYCPKCK